MNETVDVILGKASEALFLARGYIANPEALSKFDEGAKLVALARETLSVPYQTDENAVNRELPPGTLIELGEAQRVAPDLLSEAQDYDHRALFNKGDEPK